MDEGNIDATQWALFIKDLAWINRYVFGFRSLYRGLRRLYPRSQQAPVIIAELACGSGHTLQQIALWAKKKRLLIQCIG